MNSGKPESSRTGTTDWAAIGRYLAGEADTGDAEAMRQWLSTFPDEAAAIQALDAAVQRAAERSPPDIDVDLAFAAFKQRRTQRAESGWQSSNYRRLRAGALVGRWRRAVPLAAAAAACLLLVVGVVWRGQERVDSAVVKQSATLETGIGERDTLHLADGSRVILGPGSRIAVRDAGNLGGREVDLNGEAFFDVVHDTLRPFLVRAGSALIRDLGTSFGVRQDSAAGVRVVVAEGVVSVTTMGDSGGTDITLHAGDAAVLDHLGRIAVSRVDSAEEFSARDRGWLVLRDAPLAEVSAVVRRWYGLELRAPEDSQLAARRLTATFTGDAVNEMITTLELALDASARVQGDTIVLSVRRGPTRR